MNTRRTTPPLATEQRASRRRMLTVMGRSVLTAAALGALAPVAMSQAAWPTKPITFILPFAAGGATDMVSRAVAEKLQTRLGQPVIVDYKPGANGLLATKYVLQQPADGYTFLVGTSGLTQGPQLFPKEHNYDPFKDLTPVALMTASPLVLVVNPNKLPVRNMAELVEYAKARPGQISVATTGVGATDHLVGELLGLKAGLKMTFVPYKGGAAAVQDVVAGLVDMRVDSIPSSKPFIDAGKVRAIAIAGDRTRLMPELPAIGETVPGVKGEGFFALLGRTGVPAPIVERINREVNDILRMPEVASRLQGAGLDPRPGSARDLSTYMQADYDLWRDVLRATNLKVE